MPKKITFTSEQLKELQDLMNQGMRQTDIAKHFKVTDDTIRRICKENGFEVRMPHKCVCAICGETFYSNKKDAKTCNKEHHRICVVCGKDFIVDRWDIRDTCPGQCTSIKKYGTNHHLQSKKVIAKRKETCLEKYGVDNIGKLPDHLEKMEATSLQKYGVKNYASTQECQDKRRATNLEKYGCEELLANSEYRAKLDQINLEKHGTAYPMQLEEFKEKQQATMQKKYGVDNAMKDAELMARQHQAVFNHYGVNSPMKVPEIKEAMIERSLEKYGVPWAIMAPENRPITSHSKINERFEEQLAKRRIEFEPEFRLGNYLFDDRCDNILIEIDPTWSHNSAVNHYSNNANPLSYMYHKNKSDLAELNGYRCIHVFDWDDWNAIINLIAQKEKIYARKCSCHLIPRKTAEIFTSTNHIQGKCAGQILCYGLYFKGELVQVMTFGRPRYTKKYDFELLRLCSKIGVEVVGGASKLFKKFLKDNSDKNVISYCDASKFSGKVYEQIGMTFSYRTEPTKVWSKGSDKITDNLLRQRGYDQLFGTNYGKGTSNEQLMLDNGWLPVYDCGQKVFVYKGDIQ